MSLSVKTFLWVVFAMFCFLLTISGLAVLFVVPINMKNPTVEFGIKIWLSYTAMFTVMFGTVYGFMAVLEPPERKAEIIRIAKKVALWGNPLCAPFYALRYLTGAKDVFKG
jgi:hypothetical protein